MQHVTSKGLKEKRNLENMCPLYKQIIKNTTVPCVRNKKTKQKNIYIVAFYILWIACKMG